MVVKSALSLVVSIVAAFVVLWGPRTVVSASGRIFPDTSTRIGVLTDQLPGGMSAAQERFAATHYVGTQKLSLNLSRPLRAINPQFLVLHYHLAMWQSAPRVNYIVDGNRWSNDYDEVTRHESWFWHNPANQRVASNQDGKLLMNVRPRIPPLLERVARGAGACGRLRRGLPGLGVTGSVAVGGEEPG